MDCSAIPFKPFCFYSETLVYEHGELPHWRQEGCTYFVTFRLVDSIPQSIVCKLGEFRNDWLRRHGIDGTDQGWRRKVSRLPFEVKRKFERQFCKRYHAALDRGYGSCVLREKTLAEIAWDSLCYFDGDRVRTGDCVVMPNHVHVLLTPIAPFRLEDILKSVKGFSANQINKRLGRTGSFWQRQSYDHIVRDAHQLQAFQRYIADNQCKAGLSEKDLIARKRDYDLVGVS